MKRFYDGYYEERGMFFHKQLNDKGFQMHYNKILELLPTGKTLDIGCGDCVITSKIDAYGMDISNVPLKESKKIYNNLKIVCGASADIPFKSECFDTVLVSEVIEHLPEKDSFRMLHEIKRILKPGGRVLLSTVNRESIYFSFLNLSFIKGLRREGHIKEYTYEELNENLEVFFDIERTEFITRTPFFINTFITQLISTVEKPFKYVMPRLFRSWMYFLAKKK